MQGDMRFRIEVRRVQTVERWVRAPDEETALAKIRADATDPWGLFGAWKTTEMNAEVQEVENIAGIGIADLNDGPMLLSIPEAAVQLGISKATLHILLREGEVERVSIGRRTLISRDALREFIHANSMRGYAG